MHLFKSIFCFLNLVFLTEQTFRFTNLKCTEYDKSFATIPICKLKMVRRGVVAFDLHVQLHKIPVNNVTLHLQLLKKANGYRPFLYNATVDFCQFMRNSKRFPVINIVVSLLAKDSNINHTCPFNHDIIIKHLILNDEMFKTIPLPQDDYLLSLRVSAYNDLKAWVRTYFNVIDQ